MKSKLFNFLETVAALSFVAFVGWCIYVIVSAGINDDNTAIAMINPRYAQAIAIQKQANASAELARQMAEQNRMLREQLQNSSKK